MENKRKIHKNQVKNRKINISYYYRVYRNGYYTGCSGFNLVALVNDIIDIYIS